MANRIVGNVYIVDSAQGNSEIPWPSNARINCINFFSTSTSGSIVFSGTNTADVLIRIHMGEFPGNSGNLTKSLYLGGVDFKDVKIPTLQSGSAWVYFV